MKRFRRWRREGSWECRCGWLSPTTRDGGSRFQHHKDLPRVDLGTGEARLLIGEHSGAASPAVFDHPATGLDITILSATNVETNPGFEYGVVPIDRPVKVDDAVVEPGSLALVPPGYETIRLETRSGRGRLMLLGGRPLGEEVTMWWNFVARTTEEITEAWRDWQEHNDDRFAPVPSGLARIDAPRPPWLLPEK